ncbi:MAG: SDR family NAD(P)-dependent oxidoreductase [Streptosporangiales bacterium]|nr:SDR family NAD(P)-dependent oxidoreductase [Streptosporangiales bacterium]
MATTHGSHVMVNGAAGTLGSAIVAAMIDDGHRVTAFDQQPIDLAPAHRSHAAAFTGDVRDIDAVRSTMSQACKEFGALTALVICAGVQETRSNDRNLWMCFGRGVPSRRMI